MASIVPQHHTKHKMAAKVARHASSESNPVCSRQSGAMSQCAHCDTDLHHYTVQARFFTHRSSRSSVGPCPLHDRVRNYTAATGRLAIHVCQQKQLQCWHVVDRCRYSAILQADSSLYDTRYRPTLAQWAGTKCLMPTSPAMRQASSFCTRDKAT